MTTEAINRVTLDELEASIKEERYVNLGHALDAEGRTLDGTLDTLYSSAAYRTTLCVLVLDNGIVVVGKSACIDDRLFDAQIGREIARRDAIAQVWPLLGMRLADKIFTAKG